MASRLPADITRITISLDIPFAQKLFAEEAKHGDHLSLQLPGGFIWTFNGFTAGGELVAGADSDYRGQRRDRSLPPGGPRIKSSPDIEMVLNKANALFVGK